MLVVKEILFEGCIVYLLYFYFLCLGDVSKLIVYDVENICDGKSFSICCVKVI